MRRSRPARLWVCAIAAGLAAGPPAAASLVPLAQDRSVEIRLSGSADCYIFPCLDPPLEGELVDSETAPGLGPFDATVMHSGALPGCFLCGASATASQLSSIATDRIDVSAAVDAGATQFIGGTSLDNPVVSNVSARAVSRAEVRFSLDATRSFTLSGSSAAQLAGDTTATPTLQALLWEGDVGNGVPLVAVTRSCPFSCASEPFLRSGSLGAGVYTLEVTAGVHDGVGGWGPGDLDPDAFDAAVQVEAAFVPGPDPFAVPVPGAWEIPAAAGVLGLARRRLRRPA